MYDDFKLKKKRSIRKYFRVVMVRLNVCPMQSTSGVKQQLYALTLQQLSIGANTHFRCRCLHF